MFYCGTFKRGNYTYDVLFVRDNEKWRLPESAGVSVRMGIHKSNCLRQQRTENFVLLLNYATISKLDANFTGFLVSLSVLVLSVSGTLAQDLPVFKRFNACSFEKSYL